MATLKGCIVWLKRNFGSKIDAATKGTPFSQNMIIAIAMQETSYLWRRLIDKKEINEVLTLCVGDVIDAPRRKAFPVSRKALERVSNGKEMFKIAREALEAIAKIDKSYALAAKNPNKFCRGFGLFQYDLQFFRTDKKYFLTKRWATFEGTLDKCISELKVKLKKTYGPDKKTLTHDESVYVAIAYNKGNANASKSFKQGYKGSDGKYYGENIDRFLKLAERIIV
jgi:hypothetical protein